METQNLWPEFVVDKVRSPKTILKEQAGYLMEMTRNILSADIQTTTQSDGRVRHGFYIVAPAMDNYHYRVLSVLHGVFYYPLQIHTEDGRYEVEEENAFISCLSDIFKSEQTNRIVSSLLSQSIAE